jgi:hypothetical protein
MEARIMMRLAAAVGMLACFGCATSQSVGQSATVYSERDVLFMAAQSAIHDLGGRIVVADRSMGTVVGRMDVEGTPIDLTVSISGSPAPGSASGGYWDVNVRGSLVNESEPDENWQRRLRYFEEQVMDRINVSAVQPPGAGTVERPPQGLLGPASPVRPPD